MSLVNTRISHAAGLRNGMGGAGETLLVVNY